MYLQNEGVLRHETLQLFLFLFPLRHMKRPALQNKQAGVLRMAFRARKDFGTFEKRAPGWDSNPDLYDVGAALHQLSYQTDWGVVVM